MKYKNRKKAPPFPEKNPLKIYKKYPNLVKNKKPDFYDTKKVEKHLKKAPKTSQQSFPKPKNRIENFKKIRKFFSKNHEKIHSKIPKFV